MLRRLAILLVLMCQCACYGAFNVRGLRVEHMIAPEAVDVAVPRFSWVNECGEDERGQFQTAYRIVVARDTESLRKGRYVWDSGKVKSQESVLVGYGGKSLEPLTTYYWQVRTWDRHGHASHWSDVSRWSMGLPDNGWHAAWIESRDYDGRAPLLRKLFTVRKGIREARLVVCGLGYHELYVNGMKMGDELLVPNISNYTARYDLDKFPISLDNNFSDYRVLYMGHDITRYLHRGENVLGVILGNGFYAPDRSNASTFGRLCLRLQLCLRYEDGTEETIVTDGTWQTRPSAIMYNGVYYGELYDARQETPEWATTSAPADGWDNAIVVKGPDGRMTAQTSPSDRVTETLRPVAFHKVGEKTYDVDFGREISGWIRLTDITGNAGDTVRVDFVCESPQGVQQYVLKGDGAEDYAPRFTWFVFSKARITGIELTEDNLTAEAVNTDVRIDAEFTCSNSLFNRINEIWRHSQTDNMHGCIASDCPHRERLPYTGDGQATAETVMLNYDAAAFYMKWMRDMRDSQNAATGYVPNGAPWEPGCGGGVAWGAAMNIIPWQHYVQYGDRQTLSDNYPAMKAQLRHMMSWLTPEGIMFQQKRNHGSDESCYWLNLGDWCPPGELPRDQLVHTFYCWLCADYTSRAAAVLGYDEEARLFRIMAEEIYSAFHCVFYDAESKSYGKAGSNIYALRMGVPKERLQDVRNTIRKEIVEENGGHINTGFLATKYFFETLTDNGLFDVAYAAMDKRDFPGFGWWIEQGATVTWEQWDGDNSHNHPMFGGGLTWFYRRLAGVEADELYPGYRHFTIRPYILQVPCNVTYAKETPYGKLVSGISVDAGIGTIAVTVPVGSTCTLYVPSSDPDNIRESNCPIGKAKGVSMLEVQDGFTVLSLSQGNYIFEYNPGNKSDNNVH